MFPVKKTLKRTLKRIAPGAFVFAIANAVANAAVFCVFLSGCASLPVPPPAPASQPQEETAPLASRETALRPAPRETALPEPAPRATLEQARLEASKLAKSDSPRDYASPAAFANFREIRLGAIPARRLYRSSHPAQPGNPRFPYAQQLAENAHVRAVVNLVDSEARIAVYAGNIPWYQNFINRNTIAALEMGVDYTDPAFEAKLKTALLFIASRGGPYLIHGNEGRDRTGFFAALLEALMGASPEEIKEDYMASYENYYHLSPESEEYRIISVIAEDILLTITGRRPPESVNLPDAAEEYLVLRLGLAPEEIAALKERLGA
jgi:hypothetical protein